MNIVDPVPYVLCDHCNWLIHTNELHECEVCGKTHIPDETWPQGIETDTVHQVKSR